MGATRFQGLSNRISSPHNVAAVDDRQPSVKMLYEMIGIVRTGPKGAPNLTEVKEIVMTAGSLILQQGGVIRSLANWGVFALPRAVSRNQMRHYNGHYFVLRYDAASKTQEQVRSTLALDPRVVRSTSVKLGDGKLSSLSKFGAVEWTKKEF